MTLPCNRFPDHKTENGPLLPFIKGIKAENRGEVKAKAEIFPASYPGRLSGPLSTTIHDRAAVVVYYGLAMAVRIDLFQL